MYEHLPLPTAIGSGLSMRPLNPEKDASLVYEWTRHGGTQFWGMGSKSLEEIQEIYRWLWNSQTHHAYVIERLVQGGDAKIIAIFQTYDPAEDEVGEHYEVRPGDIGVHFMMRPVEAEDSTEREKGLTNRIIQGICPVLIPAAKIQRVVCDPDARNGRAIARMKAMGFTMGEVVHLSFAEKEAQLTFLEL